MKLPAPFSQPLDALSGAPLNLTDVLSSYDGYGNPISSISIVESRDRRNPKGVEASKVYEIRFKRAFLFRLLSDGSSYTRKVDNYGHTSTVNVTWAQLPNGCFIATWFVDPTGPVPFAPGSVYPKGRTLRLAVLTDPYQFMAISPSRTDAKLAPLR